MKKLLASFLALFFTLPVLAEDHIINLTIDYKTIEFAGKSRQAMAVNDQIPAPTLHFKEGDHVTINVHNQLNEETALHWHGVLVPWQMDGVLGVTQQGIPPGGAFQYRFTLHQSGTYWYHAHAKLQEQQGLYGAFIIEPKEKPSYHYTKEHVVVLSDWSNTYADNIYKNLKKDGDYYSPNFPLQPSLMRFIKDYTKADGEERKKIRDDYYMMQHMRMSMYDISDVAYDAFLLNGHPTSDPWTAPVSVGDVVRLRFIGAGGGTIFRVKIPGAEMQMVHVQGNDVTPYPIKDFTIAPGETYDVLVHIKDDQPYIIYAESFDTVGAAMGALVTRTDQPVNYDQVSPFPEPLPATREMMGPGMAMSGMNSMSPSMNMPMGNEMKGTSRVQNPSPIKNTTPSHSPMKPTSPNMPMSMPASEMNRMSDKSAPPPMNNSGNNMSMPSGMSMPGMAMSQAPSMSGKYQPLMGAVETNDPNIPIHETIQMELYGWMGRFIWFINGVPEYKAEPIILEPAKRYRIVFTNTSMMHHPMHIHGHWFILRNGQDAFDPLLHTIDVAPGATITADIDTDASGQWFFHCHFLYHMMSGMSRVIQYSTLIDITQHNAPPQNIIEETPYHNRPIIRVDEETPIDTSLTEHPMGHHEALYFSSFLDIGADPFNNAQRLTYNGLYGKDYDKLNLYINDAEIYKGTIENADIDIFYWHLIDQFWAIRGGANYIYRPATTPYWQPGIGIEGLMPYFIDTNIRSYYYSGSAKLDAEFSRDTQITNNVFFRLGVRGIFGTKTVPDAQIGSGLNQMRYMARLYYRLMPGLNLFTEFENERDYGDFKTFEKNIGELTNQNTVTFGFSLLF